MGRKGNSRGGEDEREREEWNREGEKVTEGMGGTGHGTGREGKGKGGRGGKGRRGYSPRTSIPGAANADLDPHFVNPGSAAKLIAVER